MYARKSKDIHYECKCWIKPGKIKNQNYTSF